MQSRNGDAYERKQRDSKRLAGLHVIAPFSRTSIASVTYKCKLIQCDLFSRRPIGRDQTRGLSYFAFHTKSPCHSKRQSYSSASLHQCPTRHREQQERSIFRSRPLVHLKARIPARSRKDRLRGSQPTMDHSLVCARNTWSEISWYSCRMCLQRWPSISPANRPPLLMSLRR